MCSSTKQPWKEALSFFHFYFLKVGIFPKAEPKQLVKQRDRKSLGHSYCKETHVKTTWIKMFIIANFFRARGDYSTHV